MDEIERYLEELSSLCSSRDNCKRLEVEHENTDLAIIESARLLTKAVEEQEK